MASTIYEIAKEDIVEILNVLLFAIFMGSSIECKEAHQVGELSMNIAKYFERRLGLEDHWLADNNFLCEVTKGDDLVGFEVDLQGFRINEYCRLKEHV